MALRTTHEVCWLNMLTPRPAEARSFFGALLGWTFADTGMGGTILVDGRAIGGIFDLADPRTPSGTPPLIGLMVNVASADAAAEQVRALGGEAKTPFDIGPAGRMAVCHDPTGAEIDVWEARGLKGTDVDANAIGAPMWFEVTTSDVTRAARFYEALFRWTASADGSLITQARVPFGGVRHALAEPHLATFFAVADVAETARRARGLGGEVVLVEDRLGRQTAALRSPQGVPFHVMRRSIM